LTAAAVFAWVLVFQQMQSSRPVSPPGATMDDGKPAPAAPQPAQPPAAAPAEVVAVPPVAASPSEPPSVGLAQAPSSISQAAAPSGPPKAASPRADRQPTAPPSLRTDNADTPAMRAWRQERERYADAMDDYAAREREAGYRWAKRYDVSSPRYCREAQRTRAFTQGCLAYVGG
jgi:hypothetical protein